MNEQTLTLPLGRKIVLAPFSDAAAFDLPRPFVALLPARNASDCVLAVKIISRLIEFGCVEICCAGPMAQQMHDQLDVFVETADKFEVATTWYSDNREACEYFLFAAGGGCSSLLALILEQPELVAMVREVAANVRDEPGDTKGHLGPLNAPDDSDL